MASKLNNYPPLLEYLFSCGRQIPATRGSRKMEIAAWAALNDGRAAVAAGERVGQYLNLL